MPDILVRNLDARTINRLKAKAKQNGRSLQSEAKLAIEEAAGMSPDEIREMLHKWQKVFAGRKMTPTADLIREDRDR
jgi:plasmid stability protein